MLATASGIGRNSTVGFGTGETQRDQWTEEPRLRPRSWRTGAARIPPHTMNRNTKEDHARTNRAGQHWMVVRMPLDWQLKNRAKPHADKGRRNVAVNRRVLLLLHVGVEVGLITCVWRRKQPDNPLQRAEAQGLIHSSQTRLMTLRAVTENR